MIAINQTKQPFYLFIAMGFSILLLSAGMFNFYQWHHDWVLTHTEFVSEKIHDQNEKAELIASIPKSHLFGKSFSEGNVPISNLQIHLTGIDKIEGNAKLSKVYLSMQGQPSKIYQIGDSIGFGVKVYDISDQAVILENDGHLEKVFLSREKLQFKPIVVL